MISFIYADFSEVLPYNTVLAVEINSPAALLNQLAPSQNPCMFPPDQIQQISKAIGFNPTMHEGYASAGIDLKQQIGVAITEITPNQDIGVFGWLGVWDAQKFLDYLVSWTKKDSARWSVTPKEYAASGGKTMYYVMMDQKRDFAPIIFCFIPGYCVFFMYYNTRQNATLETTEQGFINKILLPQNRLSTNENFKKVCQNLELPKDLTIYINAKESRLHNIFASDKIKNMDQSFAQSCSALGISIHLDKGLHILSCAVGEPGGGDYKNPGSCANILEAFPGKPLLACSYNIHIPQAWKNWKENYNQWIRQGWGIDVEMDTALIMLEEFLQENLGMKINLQDTVLNFQGNTAFALYALSHQNEPDADFVLVTKLNDAAKMKNLLAILFQKVRERFPEVTKFIQENDVKTTHFFSITPSFSNKMSLSFGVCQDYLVFTSKKNRFLSIVLGNKAGFWNSLSSPIATKMRDGAMMTGYVDVPKLMAEIQKNAASLLPISILNKMPSVQNKMEELTWYVEYFDHGVKTDFHLKMKSELLATIFQKMKPENKVEYDFQVIILAGNLKGKTYKGSFSYDANELTGKGEEILEVLQLQFDYTTSLDWQPKVKFVNGQFQKLYAVGGSRHQRFGINDGFSPLQFPEELRDNYFGYLRPDTYIEGCGMIRYFKKK